MIKLLSYEVCDFMLGYNESWLQCFLEYQSSISSLHALPNNRTMLYINELLLYTNFCIGRIKNASNQMPKYPRTRSRTVFFILNQFVITLLQAVNGSSTIICQVRSSDRSNSTSKKTRSPFSAGFFAFSCFVALALFDFLLEFVARVVLLADDGLGDVFPEAFGFVG